MEVGLITDVEVLLSLVVGVLYGAAIYLMLQRSILRLTMGLILLTSAANLLIFTASNITRGNPPIIPRGQTLPAPGISDPLPQALILTAIVIGFGTLAFALVLAFRAYKTLGTDDLDQMKSTDT